MSASWESVVVTGMGVASPLGCSVAALWEGLLAGRSGVVALAEPEFAGLRSRIAARVPPFETGSYFDRKEARRMSRASQLALVAAAEAVAQSGLCEGGADLDRVGVMIGSSIGGFSAADPFFRDYYQRGRISAFVIPISMNVGPSAQVSIRYGLKGPLFTVDAACASAAHSIAYAFNLIRVGMLPAAVAGGADCPLSRGVVEAWCSMRALSERNDDPAHACRPFSADRDGLVLGEGAGVLVLEAESHARARGAPVLARLAGYGASGDSHHLTQPSQDGPARAMRSALADAGLAPEEIDCINAHATGTRWNDRVETSAIKDAFGAHAYRMPVVANKAALGHSIGGSGALELIASILSLRDQRLPPTINYTTPDPECDLDYVTEGARPHAMRHVMSNSFAFGGSNAALIVSRVEAAGAGGRSGWG